MYVLTFYVFNKRVHLLVQRILTLSELATPALQHIYTII